MIAAPESPKCPICGSPDISLVNSIDTEQLIGVWKQQLNIDVSRDFQNVHNVDLFECDCCHLQFFLPDSLSGSPQLYTQLQRFDWYYMPHKWEHNAALEDMEGCERILEIGCGFGDFVARARSDKGLDAEGIELNVSAVKKAQQSGLPVRGLDLGKVATQFTGHYDAVCSFQVLEHVPNPKDFLEYSCALTKPGGKLILGLPNAESFLRYQFNILDMPPHHVTRWSSKVLHHLPKLFPLRVEHIKLEPLAEYHVVGYVNAYFSALAKYGVSRYFLRPRLMPWISEFIRLTGLRKLLTGQSLYVSFVRV